MCSEGLAAGEVGMRHDDCPREAALLESLAAAGPDGCADDLRAHVAGCASCAALTEVVARFRDECTASIHEASVPSSATMWWRLQRRARREETERAMRPITVVQAVTLACAVGVLAAVARMVVPDAARIAAWLAALRHGAEAAGAASLPSTAAQLLSPAGIALGLAGALLLIVTPVAIYFALSDR
jgi:hypothetical protein